MGIAIVVEAILSFVGLSVASGASTWGGMRGEGRLYVHQAPSPIALPLPPATPPGTGAGGSDDDTKVPPGAGHPSHILRGVNLSVPAAGVHALVGESGGG